MNGEFIGHVIAYKPRGSAETKWTEIDLPGNVNESTVSVDKGLVNHGLPGSQGNRHRGIS